MEQDQDGDLVGKSDSLSGSKKREEDIKLRATRQYPAQEGGDHERGGGDSESSSVLRALARGDFRSCLSAEVLAVYEACMLEESTSSTSIKAYILPATGDLDFGLLHDEKTSGGDIKVLFKELCRQSWDYWRQSSSVNDEMYDAAEVVYNSLKYSTLLEKRLIELVGGGSSMLLKDALGDSRLLLFLPPLVVDVLKFFFRPADLNFRNVIWHGFAAPCEVNLQFCSLLMSLCSSVQNVLIKLRLHGQDANSNKPLKKARLKQDFTFGNNDDALSSSAHKDLTQCFSHICLESIMQRHSTRLLSFLKSSHFILRGREDLVHSAFVDVYKGNYTASLVKIIPCLEHSVRLLFCLSNNEENYILANRDQYYSTLDGFGQRSKHQLLLDPFLFEYDKEKGSVFYSRKNNLLHVLGEGYYSLLVDLFFADSGPNVRAKLAHGIDAVYDSDTSENSSNHRELATVVLALYISLSSKFFRYRWSDKECCESRSTDFYECFTVSNNKAELEEDFQHILQLCCTTCGEWKSMYHPHRMLSRLFQDDAISSVGGLHEVTAIRNIICLIRKSSPRYGGNCVVNEGKSDDLIQVEIFQCDFDSPNHLQLILRFSDKESRVLCNFLFQESHHDTEPPTILSVSDIDIGTNITSNQASRSISFISRDVIQTCRELIQCNITAILNIFSSSGGANDDVGLNNIELLSVLNGFQKLACPSVKCHECTSTSLECSQIAFYENFLETVEFSDFGCALNSILSKLCCLHSHIIQALPCCFSIINNISELACKLKDAILQKESLISSGKSHTADRRQYLLQLLCLSPVVLNFAAFTFSTIVRHLILSQKPQREFGNNIFSRTSQESISYTPLLTGISSAVSSFSACVFTTSITQSSKKNPEQSLAQLQRFLKSKVVKAVVDTVNCC